MFSFGNFKCLPKIFLDRINKLENWSNYDICEMLIKKSKFYILKICVPSRNEFGY